MRRIQTAMTIAAAAGFCGAAAANPVALSDDEMDGIIAGSPPGHACNAGCDNFFSNVVKVDGETITEVGSPLNRRPDQPNERGIGNNSNTAFFP